MSRVMHFKMMVIRINFDLDFLKLGNNYIIPVWYSSWCLFSFLVIVSLVFKHEEDSTSPLKDISQSVSDLLLFCPVIFFYCLSLHSSPPHRRAQLFCPPPPLMTLAFLCRQSLKVNGPPVCFFNCIVPKVIATLAWKQVALLLAVSK